MKKNILVIAGLSLLVGGGVALMAVQQEDVEGMASGRGSKTDVLWGRLMEHREEYLRGWMKGVDEKRPTPLEVLKAWNEVALQVTGPGGFWRRQVPDRWLGCRKLPDSSACGALAASEEGAFRKYDKHISAIHAMDNKSARRYLAKHADEMVRYLDEFVPEDLSAPGMQKTTFYKENLAGAMEDDELL